MRGKRCAAKFVYSVEEKGPNPLVSFPAFTNAEPNWR
jgi:hypothetical protein